MAQWLPVEPMHMGCLRAVARSQCSAAAGVHHLQDAQAVQMDVTILFLFKVTRLMCKLCSHP